MSEILAARGVHKAFGAVSTAADVNLTFEREELANLIGANGAGKTNFLNLVTGYLWPDSGSIRFEGRELAGYTPREITSFGRARASAGASGRTANAAFRSSGTG